MISKINLLEGTELIKAKCLHDLLKHVSVEDVAKEWPMHDDNPYGNVQAYSTCAYSALYGNRELSLYIGDIEDPFTYVIDIYGDKLILVET